jgi:hypothetical protein
VSKKIGCSSDQWTGRLFDAFDSIGNTPGVANQREDLTAYPAPFWPGSIPIFR